MRCRLLAALVVLGACSSTPERQIQSVEGNVVFRLGAKPDGVEVRLESSFYPSSGYDLLTRIDGTASNITAGITLVLTGVAAPLEASGPRAPASAIVFVPVGQSVDGIRWPFTLKIPMGDSVRVDAYTLFHTAAGWKLPKTQGGFSRFEPQGSF